MKMFKKFVSLMLALMLLVCSVAFAEEGNEDTPVTEGTYEGTTGSITINDVMITTKVVNGESIEECGTTYEIYRMLDLVSFDTEAIADVGTGAYIYRVNDEEGHNWTGFFNNNEKAKELFKVNDITGHVTWIGKEETKAADAAALAKEALAWAQDSNNKITPLKTTANRGDYTIGMKAGKDNITFGGLKIGYYLIDSSIGVLCGLTTTNPDADVNAKNVPPTLDKQVAEDSKPGSWHASNSADIGQIVEFLVTIDVHAGTEKLVLHDAMTPGLRFIDDGEYKLSVHHQQTNTTTVPHEAARGTMYEVKTTDLSTECELPCDFEVVFTDEFCNKLAKNDKVYVRYFAQVTDEASIGSGAPDTNTAKLQYGSKPHFSVEDITNTYTYGFDLVKTDGQGYLLDGATFKLYDSAQGGKEIAVKALTGADGKTYYMRDPSKDGVDYEDYDDKDDQDNNPNVTKDDEKVGGDVIEVKGGVVRLVGFDNGLYYLEEFRVPNGYNRLQGRHEVSISDRNLDAIITGNKVSTDSGVQVVNNSGTMLPSTGGIGTTLFYIVGGLLAVGAVVLLITKKRMDSAE